MRVLGNRGYVDAPGEGPLVVVRSQRCECNDTGSRGNRPEWWPVGKHPVLVPAPSQEKDGLCQVLWQCNRCGSCWPVDMADEAQDMDPWTMHWCEF